MKQKLTTKFIETRKPDPEKRIDFRDTIVPGLVLRVSTAGTKTFSFHKRIDGQKSATSPGRRPRSSGRGHGRLHRTRHGYGR